MDLVRRRRGIAGLIIAALIFALLFTAGIGYLLFQAKADMQSYQAGVQAQEVRLQVNQEQLTIWAKSPVAGNPVTITVNDTGSFPVSVVSWYVKDMSGKVVAPGLTPLASPLNLNVGYVGSVTTTGYNYPSAGTLIYVSMVTSRGNTFTIQVPTIASITTATISSATTTTESGLGNGGGNSLVVVMSATPVQAFGGNTITDNVTLFNYAGIPMTGATLNPTRPSNTTTGTAKADFLGCAGPYTPPGKVSDPSGTIAAYSGVGTAPHIYFLCTYKAITGTVGGLASFTGGANATQSGSTVYSASVTSNLVQIGGLTNSIAQGAFTSNFFFFKYSACTNAPSSGRYSPSCSTNVGMPPANPYALPEGAVISGGSYYYVAFYIQITNNFNTSLPLLSNTFEQFDQSSGGESDWWLVGTNSSYSNGAYYPNYAPGGTGIPTLTAYPTDCNVVNANNIPTDSKCIYVKPGASVVITLASCGPGATGWDWGGTRRGASFDAGATCTSATPSIGSGGSATAGITVISFFYKGSSLTEDLAFQGVAFTA